MTNLDKDHWDSTTSVTRYQETISDLLVQLERLEARLIEVESLAANLAHQLKREHDV